ncbi:hypothetical protein DFH06DRAFT_1171866 [Mycena polygramma]|nr:hypothetical protein DFH06DRAFT_1171866 [Mycena polygramma]
MPIRGGRTGFGAREDRALLRKDTQLFLRDTLREMMQPFVMRAALSLPASPPIRIRLLVLLVIVLHLSGRALGPIPTAPRTSILRRSALPSSGRRRRIRTPNANDRPRDTALPKRPARAPDAKMRRQRAARQRTRYPRASWWWPRLLLLLLGWRRRR